VSGAEGGPDGLRRAAVGLWVRPDGRVLVVWNRRYRGWTLPGGLVEPGESPAEAVVRELDEETGAHAEAVEPLYEAPVEKVREPQRGQHVHVYRIVAVAGTPREREPGCPVSWFLREDFLASCPFERFYRRMFEVLLERHHADLLGPARPIEFVYPPDHCSRCGVARSEHHVGPKDIAGCPCKHASGTYEGRCRDCGTVIGQQETRS
jgi:ADP-ribose pyrophosphatase YjhB (NUDIX family)